MSVDTLERSPPFSSMPCFDLVTDIGDRTPSSSIVPSFFLFSKYYLRLHPLTLVYANPFFPFCCLLLTYILVWLTHAATSLHGLLPTSLFFGMFLPLNFLGGLMFPHSPTLLPATIPLGALPFHSFVRHLHCISVSSPSCVFSLLETAPECLMHHASKCSQYPVLAL